MTKRKIVCADRGAAVVSAAEVIEITGTWKPDELMKIFDAMENVQEAEA